MNNELYALLSAVLTPSGHLLSNLHFQVLYIGDEESTWEAFYRCAEDLYDVDIMSNPYSPTARGIEPENGFTVVYRIQLIN